ncbi:MAG: sigma-70 family RNA polymerase sigma factor [Phototrophicaceae bacterium]
MIVLILPDVSSDDRLLNRARDGDKDAITQIYHHYVESIYQFCKLRLGHPQQAEDITSMVFTKFVQAVAQGKAPRYHLRGWLFKVARNAIYDTYGEQKTLPLETLEQWENPDAIDPEYLVQQSLNLDMIRESIMQLSPDQQDVILLRFDQQLSVQETADILGKKVNTVKALQLRAVSRLRTILQGSGVKA